MTHDAPRPLVLVPACNRWLGGHPYHVAGNKYVDFVRLAGCLPLVVPDASADEAAQLLALADGVLLTGSPSNVEPRHFGEAVLDPALPLDPQRDAWTLPLVPQLLARGLPLFAICRGGPRIVEARARLVPGQPDATTRPELAEVRYELDFGPVLSAVVKPFLPRVSLWFDRAVPEGAPYWTHTLEGDDDMPAHVKAALLGPTLTLPLGAGRPLLGTWQGIYLCEHRDHGGSRRLVATLNGEASRPSPA